MLHQDPARILRNETESCNDDICALFALPQTFVPAQLIRMPSARTRIPFGFFAMALITPECPDINTQVRGRK
ncbi:MAG: hypothetical protein A3F73_06710 [Gallionellales bacterium RIFCSPLOWO2_12_FULL_59_22]|nr:MAG: hypothetical protein A3H99_04490 [Gallionellales bacterium RIFCSPLOWO2_02_FULL_59_110]OGT05516.1 MAG: hypothetical protein A2Z65_01275 [Gallionellales bacterium RIFCSPLOWO2_02_58_13]OGT11158.1 MAG: hypothetical protein A3F73_06710 [Gallionellales bacterium RIFCSPLOWO2_12_FULL_59_22]